MAESNDLQNVVTKGDLRKSLEALRDLLVVRLLAAEDRDTAALTRELRTVLAEIEAIPVAREASVADNLAREHDDELAKRRASPRRKNAPGL